SGREKPEEPRPGREDHEREQPADDRRPKHGGPPVPTPGVGGTASHATRAVLVDGAHGTFHACEMRVALARFRVSLARSRSSLFSHRTPTSTLPRSIASFTCLTSCSGMAAPTAPPITPPAAAPAPAPASAATIGPATRTPTPPVAMAPTAVSP